MKKHYSEATVEELLFDISSYEDPDSMLLIAPLVDGGVCVMSYAGEGSVMAPTLREALIKYNRNWLNQYGCDEEYDSFELNWQD